MSPLAVEGWLFEFNNGRTHFEIDRAKAREIARELDVDERCTKFVSAVPVSDEDDLLP